jgi:hypothetical protein
MAQDIASEWLSFTPERRKGLLARMSPEQKRNLRTAIEGQQQPAPAARMSLADLRAEAARRAPGQLRPAAGGAGAWLGDVERDIRAGGRRTVAGRVLGYMQGQGQRGYSGLQAGVSPGTAEFVGSLPLGAVKTAQGVAEYWSGHPVRGGLKALGGIAQMATIPSAFMGGPGAEKVIEAVPSAKYAGQVLAAVERDAGHLPVDLSRSAEPLLRVKDLADRGGVMPTAVRKLLLRATEPGGKPISFSELKDFYSNITSLTAKEKMSLTPIMRRQLGMTAAALKQDLAATAAQVGKSAEYLKGMGEYASAMKLQRTANEVGKWLIRAGGVGGTAELAKLVWHSAK